MRKGVTIALAGNPNGKSTLFNALTGSRQHTGNWAGKTVETAQGQCQWRGQGPDGGGSARYVFP